MAGLEDCFQAAGPTPKLLLRRRERCGSFILTLLRNILVRSGHRIAMDSEISVGQVDDPILNDTRTSVQTRLRRQIMVNGMPDASIRRRISLGWGLDVYASRGRASNNASDCGSLVGLSSGQTSMEGCATTCFPVNVLNIHSSIRVRAHMGHAQTHSIDYPFDKLITGLRTPDCSSLVQS